MNVLGATKGGPEAYLCDVLTRVADHPINRIADLLPWHWALTQRVATIAA
jgi:transposase